MKKIIKLNESTIKQMVRESIEDEMALWDERDNSPFGRVISQLDEIMKETFSEANEYGFQESPISRYVTMYSLDGHKEYTAKAIYEVLENYDMLHNTPIKRLVKKMIKLSKEE